MIHIIKDLVSKCIEGSVQAQRQLFDRYYSYGYSVSRRYSSNTEDAKEILNNAYLRVFRKLALYNPSLSFNSWFSRIIIHASSDYYRYAKESHIALEERYETIPDTNLDAIDQLSYQELINCISDLSKQYRTVFNMYVIDGYKHREIAQMLSISEGTSKSNLSKAKQQLQNIIRAKHEIKKQNT